MFVYQVKIWNLKSSQTRILLGKAIMVMRWCGDDQDDDNKDDQRDNNDDGDDNNDDQGDDDDDDCRTGQSGWEDGNSKCKSEGDAQLATIKWVIIKSIKLSDYIKLLDYIELSESEGDAQLATIKWVIDNWLDTVSMRK